MTVSRTAGYKQSWAYDRLRKGWLGDFVRGFRGCRRELAAWMRSPRVTVPEVEQLVQSLAIYQPPISDESPAERESEAPIFLLSTGWRAGSTLLQRVLVTDPRLLLWGEPLGEMTIVSRLAETISHSISPRNRKLWNSQPDPASAEMSSSWIANLYPPGNDFRTGLRRLFDGWLEEPARQRGFARWGFKEVRLGATEASLLHWLYPHAKFAIISRHPFDSYRSLADAGWGQVYYRYPDADVDSALNFARHWNRLAVSWSRLPAGFPCVHIRYEDLIAGKVDFRKLESWLGLEIREHVALSASVGGTAKRAQLSWYERWIIAREAAAGMKALGYQK